MSVQDFIENDQKKRGGCLAAFLIGMIILNSIVSLYYVFAGDTVKLSIPTMSTWMIYVYALGSLLNVVFAYLVWTWRRIGLYGFASSAIIIFLLNLSIGINLLSSIFGLLGPLILVLLVRPVWKFMK